MHVVSRNGGFEIFIFKGFGTKEIHAGIQSILFGLGVTVGGHAHNEKARTAGYALSIQ